MDLKKALELGKKMGLSGEIRFTEDGYICLSDIIKYFPGKDLKSWIKQKATQELIIYYEKETGKKSIKAIQGRTGGFYAIDIIAFELLMYLSIEFKKEVYQKYENNTKNIFKGL